MKRSNSVKEPIAIRKIRVNISANYSHAAESSAVGCAVRVWSDPTGKPLGD